MSGGHVIFALGGCVGFTEGWCRNITAVSRDGSDLALQRLNLFLDGNDALELACR